VALQFSVRQLSDLEVGDAAERRPAQVLTDLVLAGVGSDEKQATDVQSSLDAEGEVEKPNDPGASRGRSF
jgi:hypothetical protein